MIRDKSNYSVTKPNLRVSRNKWNDKEFQANVMSYFDAACNNFSSSKADMDIWYRIANGELIDEHTDYVTNPFGNAVRGRPELQGYPARMRNYDIVSSLIGGLLMGEKNRRRLVRQCVALDTDFPEIREERMYQKVLDSMIQEYQHAVGLTGEEPPTVEEIQAEIEAMKDERAIAGTKTLKVVDQEHDIPRKQRRGFYDWLVTGMVFSYKDLYYDDIEYDICSVRNIDFLLGEQLDFIENGEAVKYTKNMPINEVVDRFSDMLKEEEIRHLESRYSKNSTDTKATHVGGLMSDIDPFSPGAKSQVLGSLFSNTGAIKGTSTDVSVTHIVFRGFVKIGMLRTRDIFGNLVEQEVDEDFKPMEGEKVEWKWVDQIFEGYYIDDLYTVGVQEIPYRRGSFFRPRDAKLPYNGRLYTSNPESKPISVVQRLYPYQIKYNIIHYRLELTLAKNKDKMIFLPFGIVPDEDSNEGSRGWDRFTTMYYADATGYLWYDETDPKITATLQHVKALDASLNQYIREIYAHLRQVRQEAMELVGLNDTRTGDISASETVGNAQEKIFRSNLMTEEMFVQYEEFQEKDYQGLLDLAQFAYAHGKRLTIPKEDGSLDIYDLNPELFSSTRYKVYVKSGAEMQEDLERLKANAQAFAQNSMSPALLARVVHEKDYHQLLKNLDEAEMNMQQRQQQGMQADIEKEKMKLQAEMADSQAERESKELISARKDNTSIQVALIQNMGGGTDTGGATAPLDVQSITDFTNELALRREELAVRREENAIKLADSNNKVAIAKENKYKHEVRNKK